MRLKLTQECSQKWYLLRSWRYWNRDKKRYSFAGFRKLGKDGIAFGPVMFFWRDI